VVAMRRDVAVGFGKPTMAKMVAEKYIKEFCRSQLADLRDLNGIRAWGVRTNPQSC
jgi:hypothetical protein